LGGAVASLSAIAGFLVSKKIVTSQFDILEEQAKAKAKVIESEAEVLLQKSSLKSQKIEIEAQKKYDEIAQRVKVDLDVRINEVEKLERETKQKLTIQLSEVESKQSKVDSYVNRLKQSEVSLENEKLKYEKALDEHLHVVENAAGLTKEEAKKILLEKVEETSRADIAHIVRKCENEAKEQGKKSADYILALATSKFAGEFASERLTSSLHIDDDELKGRIIGREGRNIKALEALMGVDIIIDDTPKTILISSFNLYRRAIATKTLELLIEDGRIQPARIEEIFEKVSSEFEEAILHEGEDILLENGITSMHPELTKLIGKLRYRASYGQNALAHTLEVANLAGLIAAELGGDVILAKRAGLLHDIGKSLTHDHDGNHVDLGAEICRKYAEDEVVINAIYAHHGHEDIKSVECAAVCAGDALSAARPGARREVLENFLKRVTEIEAIATGKNGVKQAYAINAGREVRVIVNAEVVSDDETTLLAKEIAKEIEGKVQYPGEIKVNVIREIRTIEYAQ